MNILKNNLTKLYIKIIDQVFRPMKKGRLIITLPDAKQLTYGDGENGIKAYVCVENPDFFRKCVLYGAVGFGESYVDGDWKTENLPDVIAWMIDNHAEHPTMGVSNPKKYLVNILSFFGSLSAKLRVNTIKGSQRNIMDHYDLGNDFFKSFLDPTMTYSSAYFSDGTKSLEDAQLQKYEELCKKLKLKPSDHLLEIGTGWGGFAVYAAQNYGCRITTTTISKQQYEFAKKRFEECGLTEKIDIQLCDYRYLKGEYDKIVSIEMIEAVGHEFLETYFRQCHRLLKPEGLLALQKIQFPDHRYDQARKNIDWIQKHIFPGSLLPSQEAIQKAMKKTGTLGLYNYEDITPHYVKTLKIWRERFINNIKDIKSLGKDEIFKRKWIYYLAYCEAAFKMRHINVAQAVYTRSNNTSLHDPLEAELNFKDQKLISDLNKDVISKVRG